MQTLTLTKSHYMTLTDFDGSVANAGDPGTFDDAVDQFAEQMDEGRASAVFRVDPATADAAAMMVDVTEDACFTVLNRCVNRDVSAPEWAVDGLVAA